MTETQTLLLSMLMNLRRIILTMNPELLSMLMNLRRALSKSVRSDDKRNADSDQKDSDYYYNKDLKEQHDTSSSESRDDYDRHKGRRQNELPFCPKIVFRDCSGSFT